jgi:CxxC-x17-CxxC domain-containing protein
MAENIEDKILICTDCGNKFMWTVGEQKFFYDKGLQNIPKRCKPCAAIYKAKLTEKHPRFWIKCDHCKKKSEVPFEAKKDSPILCEKCFLELKTERDRKLATNGKSMRKE